MSKRKRNLRNSWRELARGYARTAWHISAYRFFDADTAPNIEIVKIAMIALRERLNSTYAIAMGGKRRRLDHVFQQARELASAGLYLLQIGAKPNGKQNSQ